MDEAEKTRVLWDERQITRTLRKFAHSLDTKDWAAHQACFTDPVNIDFSKFTAFEEVRVGADLWSRFAELILGTAPRHHLLSTPDIAIEGDTAHAIVQMISSLWTQTALSLAPNRQYGWYEVWLERRGEEWKIARLKHDFRGVEGEAETLENHSPEFARIVQEVFSSANEAAAKAYLNQVRLT